MTLQNSDLFLVERDSTNYKETTSNLMANLEDTDLMLVERDTTNYKITGLEMKQSLGGGAVNPGSNDFTFSPAIEGGTGTEADPYIITSVTVTPAGASTLSAQTITISYQEPGADVFWENKSDISTMGKFDQAAGVIAEDGTYSHQLTYIDQPPTGTDQTYIGVLKLGLVYFNWSVQQFVSSYPPVISSVTVEEDTPGGNRFTSQAFTATVGMEQEGYPQSTKTIDAYVKGSVLAIPQTSESTGQTSTAVQYSQSLFGDLSSGSYFNAFDGDVTTNCVGTSGGTLTWQATDYNLPEGALFEFLAAEGMNVVINDGVEEFNSNGGSFTQHQLGSNVRVTKLTVTALSGSPQIGALKFDGHVLIDNDENRVVLSFGTNKDLDLFQQYQPVTEPVDEITETSAITQVDYVPSIGVNWSDPTNPTPPVWQVGTNYNSMEGQLGPSTKPIQPLFAGPQWVSYGLYTLGNSYPQDMTYGHFLEFTFPAGWDWAATLGCDKYGNYPPNADWSYNPPLPAPPYQVQALLTQAQVPSLPPIILQVDVKTGNGDEVVTKTKNIQLTGDGTPIVDWINSWGTATKIVTRFKITNMSNDPTNGGRISFLGLGCIDQTGVGGQIYAYFAGDSYTTNGGGVSKGNTATVQFADATNFDKFQVGDLLTNSSTPFMLKNVNWKYGSKLSVRDTPVLRSSTNPGEFNWQTMSSQDFYKVCRDNQDGWHTFGGFKKTMAAGTEAQGTCEPLYYNAGFYSEDNTFYFEWDNAVTAMGCFPQFIWCGNVGTVDGYNFAGQTYGIEITEGSINGGNNYAWGRATPDGGWYQQPVEFTSTKGAFRIYAHPGNSAMTSPIGSWSLAFIGFVQGMNSCGEVESINNQTNEITLKWIDGVYDQAGPTNGAGQQAFWATSNPFSNGQTLKHLPAPPGTGTVLSSDAGSNTLTVIENTAFTTGRTVLGDPVTINDVTKYLKFDSSGNVEDLIDDPQSPAYMTVATDPVLTLTFPATFPNGVPPDSELLAGTELTVTAWAQNSMGRSPGSGTIDGGVTPGSSVTYGYSSMDQDDFDDLNANLTTYSNRRDIYIGEQALIAYNNQNDD